MSFSQALTKLLGSSKNINVYFDQDDHQMLNKLATTDTITSIMVYKPTYDRLKSLLTTNAKIWTIDLTIDEINRLGYSKMLKNYIVFIRERDLNVLFKFEKGNKILSVPLIYQDSFSVCVLDQNSSFANTNEFDEKNDKVRFRGKTIDSYAFFNENFPRYDSILYENKNYQKGDAPEKLTPGRIYILLKHRAEKLNEKGKVFVNMYLSSKGVNEIKSSNYQKDDHIEKAPELTPVVPEPAAPPPRPRVKLVDVKPSPDDATNFEYFNIHGDGGVPRTTNELVNGFTETKYKQTLYTFLQALLQKMIPESETDERNTLMNTLLNESTLDSYWVPCFRHKSMNPNVGSNYETFEAVGDKLMSYCFKSYLYKRYKTISESQLNDLDTKVNSKEFQGKIGQTIGFWDYLIHAGIDDTIPSIHEDMLEAFCGCLDTILNDKLCIGVGSIIIYNMYSILLANTEFDIETSDCQKDSINPKTWITQLFEILGKKKNDRTITISKPISFKNRNEDWNQVVDQVKYVFDQSGIELNIKGQNVSTFGFQELSEQKTDGFHVQVSLLDQGRRELENLIARYNLGIDLSRLNTILGRSSGNVKSVAATKAYKQAKNTLEQIGFTKEVVLGLKYKIKILKSLNGDVDKESRLYAKVRSEHSDMKHVIICDVWESIDYKLVQLIVINKANRQSILTTLKAPSSEKQDIYARLIDKYLAE